MASLSVNYIMLFFSHCAWTTQGTNISYPTTGKPETHLPAHRLWGSVLSPKIKRRWRLVLKLTVRRWFLRFRRRGFKGLHVCVVHIVFLFIMIYIYLCFIDAHIKDIWTDIYIYSWNTSIFIFFRNRIHTHNICQISSVECRVLSYRCKRSDVIVYVLASTWLCKWLMHGASWSIHIHSRCGLRLSCCALVPCTNCPRHFWT